MCCGLTFIHFIMSMSDDLAGAGTGAAVGTAIMPGVGTALGAGLGFVGGLLNSSSQSSQNQKNRDFSMQMYQRQYNDSVNFWNMQNQYNSPSAQMARLKAAGLNPNMVYGSGSAAGNVSGSPALPAQASYHGEAPNPGQAITGALGSLGNYYNLATQQAQLDNVHQQNKLIAAQTLKTLYDATGSDIGNKFNKQTFDARASDVTAHSWLTTNQNLIAEQNYNYLQKLNPMQLEAARLGNQDLTWKIRNDALQPSLTKQTIQSVGLRNLMDSFETNLNKVGLTKSDPEWQRILSMILQSN